MIQKPYGINLKDQIIDRNADYLLRWSTSGDVSTSFSINIYNLDDDSLVWSLPRTYSLALSYTLPANALSIGSKYKINITVWNSNEQSATSNFVTFSAMSKPVISVTPIETVANHSYLFTATYTQAEGIPLSYYVVNLYDSNQKLFKTSGIKTDGLLEQRFELLKNGTNYYIEFKVTAKQGLTVSSGLIPFTVTYENPSMYFQLSANPVTETASVKLDWKIMQVIGKTSIKPRYINGSMLDVRGGKLFFDEGFEIENDFTLKIWFQHLVKDVDVIYFQGLNGHIRVQYKSDNRFHLYKQINGYNYHYSSNEIDSDGVFLCLQQKNSRMDMYTEITDAIEIISIKDKTFEQLNGFTFSQLSNSTFS
jgi:hypothetical protein